MDSSYVYLSTLTYLGSTMSSSFIRVLEGGKMSSPPLFFLFLFVAESCYVAQTGLKDAILLPQSPSAEITGMCCYT